MCARFIYIRIHTKIYINLHITTSLQWLPLPQCSYDYKLVRENVQQSSFKNLKSQQQLEKCTYTVCNRNFVALQLCHTDLIWFFFSRFHRHETWKISTSHLQSQFILYIFRWNFFFFSKFYPILLSVNNYWQKYYIHVNTEDLKWFTSRSTSMNNQNPNRKKSPIDKVIEVGIVSAW